MVIFQDRQPLIPLRLASRDSLNRDWASLPPRDARSTNKRSSRQYIYINICRSRILGLKWDKSLKSFPPPTPTPPPLGKSGLNLVCNVIIVYRNLKSVKLSRLCPETSTKLSIHEFWRAFHHDGKFRPGW
jgi:hypothetical protein